MSEQRETKFDSLRYQREFGKPDRAAYEIYRADVPYAHVATVNSEDAARLFVAAPDLYAACEELLTHASLTEHMSASIIERTRAALAKARGESK